MDDAAAAWVHPVFNLRGDALEATDLTQMPDEPRSLGAKLSRALGPMCTRHGEQKKGTFYHALIQDMERYHTEQASFVPGQTILRKALQSV